MSQEKDRPPWPFARFKEPSQSGEKKPYERDGSLDVVNLGERHHLVTFSDHDAWCAQNGDHMPQVMSVGPFHTDRCANFEKHRGKKKPS